MAPIAEHRIGGVLAAAKTNGLRFGRLKFDGRHSASFVAAVAEGLGGAFAAGTPKIAFAGFDIDGVGGLLCNDWLCHGELSLKSCRDIIADCRQLLKWQE
jgi:hypothetical protein